MIDLCHKWGLQCDWAPPWIHASLLEWEDEVRSTEKLVAVFYQHPVAQREILVSGGPDGEWVPVKRERGRLRRALTRFALQEMSEPSIFGTSDASRESWGESCREQTQHEAHEFSLRSFQSFEFSIDGFHFEMDIPSWDWTGEKWKDAEKRILKEARRQRDEARTAHIRAGFILRDAEPSLRLHIHWLHLRICPQPNTGKPLGWSEIKRYKDWHLDFEHLTRYLTPSAVQKAVEPLADELSIHLPGNLRPGRPRKY